ASPDGGDCTASILARDLPRSPRGYEVADRVTWVDPRPPLDPAQAAALTAWQLLEALDATGDLGATPQVSRPQVLRGLPSTITPLLAAIAVAYVLALLGAAGVTRARRAGLAATACVFVVVTAAACLAVGAIGHVGGTRAVQV